MPHDLHDVPVLGVLAVIDALKADIKNPSNAVLCCPHPALSSGLLMHMLSRTVCAGATVSCWIVTGTYSNSCSSGLVVIAGLLLLVAMLELSQPAGNAHITVRALGDRLVCMRLHHCSTC